MNHPPIGNPKREPAPQVRPYVSPGRDDESGANVVKALGSWGPAFLPGRAVPRSELGGGQRDLGWIDNVKTAGVPEANKWHHLVYTFDETSTRVYADGVLWNEQSLADKLGIDTGT